ncbi:antitoxin Phd [Desulfitispora alkaliphila]|uniref:hypothetical protein n=1 Tax=Desulfitispora alkaliphila TaxID=622674 RepID=UPI003D1D171C
MEVNLESLVSLENLKSNVEGVLQIVERNGKVVLLKDNQPVYIIIKYDSNSKSLDQVMKIVANKNTLQEAMKIVLLESEDKAMHAAELADTIFDRKLYLKKDGTKAEYTQIRARCGHYPDLFEALPGNIIKLKEGVE